jgi:N-acetylmuramoyl-L-alanine amidase
VVIFLKKQKIHTFLFIVAVFMACVSVFIRGSGVHPVMSTMLSGKVIILDAGHGTPDGGATGYSGSKEKDLNLLVAKSLGNMLMQSGAHVIYTRQDDESIAYNTNDSIKNIKRNDMKKRKEIRDGSGADMFISIHMNNFPEKKYRGAQVFYNTILEDNRILAKAIQSEIKTIADNSNNRSEKESKDDIYLLNESKIPSVLVECGFISNPDEEKLLLTKAYQEKIAYSIYSGILKYYKEMQQNGKR